MITLRFLRSWNLIIVIFIVGISAAGCNKATLPEKLPSAAVELQIHDIQGCTHQSPYTGSVVEDLSGIVTGKITNGFYLQDDQPDDLFCSSEAIFVFTNTFPDVLPGDRLSVSGKVDEYRPGGFDSGNLTLTQLTSPEITRISRGNSLPAVTVIGLGGIMPPSHLIDDDSFTIYDPQTDGIDFYESLESMLIKIDAGVVVGPRNKYNEIVILPIEDDDDNLVSATGALIQQEHDANPERIILNLNQENRAMVHVGGLLSEPVIGIMDYSYGNFKVNVFGIAAFSKEAYPIEPIEITEDRLSIATYNVENLSRFDASRLTQLAEDIRTVLGYPDVLVLHEILDDSGVEDDGEVSAALTLKRLTELIGSDGGVSYGYIDNPPKNNQDGGIEGGNIRSVMLYRLDTLRIADVKDGGLSKNPTRIGAENWPFSATRKPLVVLFERGSTRFLVVAPHLTSRGADTPLFGDRQPPEKPEGEKRISQAVFINEYLSNFRKRNPDIPIIVAGDLNDDPWSKTLQALKGDLLVDMSSALPANERFTYILDGNAVQLDYIFLSGDTDWSSSIQIVHLNSVFDHKVLMSDHDPVIAQFTIP